MTKLYPFQFKETLKEKIWGGDSMGPLLGKQVPAGATIGESWEISDHGNDSSIIAHGPLSGTTLHEVFKNNPADLLGTKLSAKYADTFPLLIKFLDARDNLSVQVHPNDAQAKELEVDELGKTECWYVLHAEEDATIIKGVNRDLSKDEFKNIIAAGGVMDVLDCFSVATGDFLFLPAGTIHAICSGTVIAEIQQNSDTTYRVYDYDRPGLDGKARELHVDKTLAVAHLHKNTTRLETPQPLECIGARRESLVACDKFWVDKLTVVSKCHLETSDAVHILMVIDGEGELVWREEGAEANAEKSIAVIKGATILVPASVVSYTLVGSDLQVLLSSPV